MPDDESTEKDLGLRPKPILKEEIFATESEDADGEVEAHGKGPTGVLDRDPL